MEHCPHCGTRVLLEADGRCPTCRIPADAPVTESDQTRIAAWREVDRTRRELADAPAAPALSWGVAAVPVLAGATFAAMSVGPVAFASNTPPWFLDAASSPAVLAGDLSVAVGLGAGAAIGGRWLGGHVAAAGIVVLQAAIAAVAAGSWWLMAALAHS